jgi:galactokinase
MSEAEQTLFLKLHGRAAEILASAPGRINIIGEHTDYNNGYVLPAAIHLRNYFLASRRPDNEIHFWANNFSEMDIFSLGQLEPSSSKRWVNYIRGIFWALREEGADLGGVDGLVWGDVPLEAGLSSSAALEVSVVKGLAELFGLSIEPEKLARLAQKAEHEFSGVKCGLMDQFVAVFGQKDSALFLDCETLAFDLIPLNLDKAGLEILVCDTRVRRELASSEYNKRREESASALNALGKRGVRTFKETTLDLLDEAKPVMEDINFRRARHVISENQRVKASAEALRKDDFTLLGRLLFQSHESLRDDYEVSCQELDLVYKTAKEFTGCLGARLVGAGFGGSALALITKAKAEEFKSKLSARAEERGFLRPEFHDISVGGGACSERLLPI